MTAAGPSGVVTFLFTDIEGSTRRWESDADAMRAALLKHDDVLRDAIEKREGFLFSHTGDGVVAAFTSPRSAVDAAVASPALGPARGSASALPQQPATAGRLVELLDKLHKRAQRRGRLLRSGRGRP